MSENEDKTQAAAPLSDYSDAIKPIDRVPEEELILIESEKSYRSTLKQDEDQNPLTHEA